MAVRPITRGEILDHVTFMLQDQKAVLRSNLVLWLHQIHRDIESSYDYSWLRASYTIPLANSTADFNLPYDFSRTVDQHSVVYTNDTGPTRLSYVTEDEFDRKYWSTRNDTGETPTIYRLHGAKKFVQVQPSSASVLSLVSTSASDVYSVFIKGMNASGQLIYESKTLSGTTPVSSANTYTSVQVISGSNASVGTLTVTSNAGGVTNVILSPQSTSIGYKTISPYPILDTTSSVKNLEIQYYRQIPDLIHDQDISIVPNSNALIHGLLWLIRVNQNDPQANQQMGLYGSEKMLMQADDALHYDKLDSVSPYYFEERTY